MDEKWRVSYGNLKQLKIGDVVVECAYGKCIKSEVTTKVKEKYNKKLKAHQLSWKGKNLDDGEIINYLYTENHSHYSDIAHIESKEER